MQIERITSRGQLVPVLLMQDNLAASQTDVALVNSEVNAGAGNAVDSIPFPFDGEIVGIGWRLSAAGSAGTLTITPTVGGTKKTTLAQTVTTAQTGSGKCLRGSIPFAANDLIGCKITTDGSWNGTTADLWVVVYCLTYLDGI